MLFIDPTEARANSRLPALPNAVQTPDLEAHTGADLLVSPLDIPATTETLIRKHISAGAIMVQRKSGMDLIHSLGEVLNGCLARMRDLGAQSGQCCLLFIGTLEAGQGGTAIVDGREASQYWAVRGALSRWCHRGGHVVHLNADGEIPHWLDIIQRAVTEYREHPTKAFYAQKPYPPDPPKSVLDPLQLLLPVKDGRLVIASFPGVGPKRAETLYHESGYHLGRALRLMTDPTSPKWQKVPGWGVDSIRAVRALANLEDGEVIGTIETQPLQHTSTLTPSVQSKLI